MTPRSAWPERESTSATMHGARTAPKARRDPSRGGVPRGATRTLRPPRRGRRPRRAAAHLKIALPARTPSSRQSPSGNLLPLAHVSRQLRGHNALRERGDRPSGSHLSDNVPPRAQISSGGRNTSEVRHVAAGRVATARSGSLRSAASDNALDGALSDAEVPVVDNVPVGDQSAHIGRRGRHQRAWIHGRNAAGAAYCAPGEAVSKSGA